MVEGASSEQDCWRLRVCRMSGIFDFAGRIVAKKQDPFSYSVCAEIFCSFFFRS